MDTLENSNKVQMGHICPDVELEFLASLLQALQCKLDQPICNGLTLGLCDILTYMDHDGGNKSL